MITFGLDLNLIPGKVLPRLNVSQYDKGQTVSVSLWNGDVPYSIPAGCTAQVVGTKADKTGFMYECTIENGQPSFVITNQMTVFPGEVTLEVIIMDADNRIGTVNFILDVERAALADDTQISESDLPIIQQLPEIRAEVEAAAALAEAWAVGPGTEQEPSATNNAYYWAMQAASAAGGGLKPSVVPSLPTQNISTSTIYFVPAADPSSSNYYDEYINLDGTSQGWELIGTTAIDLTDYYTKGEVDALLATINGNVTTLDTQLKACSGQAAPYSTTKNYVPTDMVYHNDMLYQCIGAHTGAWDDLYFEPVDLSLLQTRYNNLNTHLTASDNLTFRFASDGEGNHGYLGADDSFIPFKSGYQIIEGLTDNNSHDDLQIVSVSPANISSASDFYKVFNGMTGNGWYINGTGNVTVTLKAKKALKDVKIMSQGNMYARGYAIAPSYISACSLTNTQYGNGVAITNIPADTQFTITLSISPVEPFNGTVRAFNGVNWILFAYKK